MEKRLKITGKLRKIAIIGPECTGKTTLSKQLAEHFGTIWIEEFARVYIENLTRKYTYKDVELIARYQKDQIHKSYEKAYGIIFFDTDLIITKVWFDIVYKKVPSWLDKAINKSGFDLYLLCNTDIPWEADNVRENGGQMREILFNNYKHELDSRQFSYRIIKGTGDERFLNAVSFVNSEK